MIDKVIELRDVVNDFFRGNISREQAVAKLGLYENESWFKERYLYSSSELPADITKRNGITRWTMTHYPSGSR